MSENTPYPDRWYVIDIETTVRNKGPDAIGAMQASPFYAFNTIVLYGELSKEGYINIKSCFPDDYIYSLIEHHENIYVFHNAKFDLLWMLRENLPVNAFLGMPIWDTMVVEYLLSGQQKMYASLNELAVKYGGTPKNDRIAEYWKEGLDTTDIPEDELREYLEDDLHNTGLVFLSQLDRAKKLGMLNFIYCQMEALKTTILMEYNGMYIDTDIFSNNMQAVHKELTEVEQWLIGSMSALGIVNANPASPHHIALAIYGGEQEYLGVEIVKDDEGNPIKYKTGKKAGMVKTRKKKTSTTISGIVTGHTVGDTTHSSTDDRSLKSIVSLVKIPLLEIFINNVLKYRELAKDFNTYYIGIGKLIWPDSCIHGSISHCGTVTGRLASSKPNLQNITNREE